MNDKLTDRLKAAVEGECDGLAITDDQAAKILDYVLKSEPICSCDIRTRLVGDGCEVCNPELAKEIAAENRTGGWLQSGGLLYRLTDERAPTNRDEINITMAESSRDDRVRACRAAEIREWLNGEARAEATDDWIPVSVQRPLDAGIAHGEGVLTWNVEGFPGFVEARYVTDRFPEYTHWKRKPAGPVDAARVRNGHER